MGLLEAVREFCEFGASCRAEWKLAPDDIWENAAYVFR